MILSCYLSYFTTIVASLATVHLSHRETTYVIEAYVYIIQVLTMYVTLSDFDITSRIITHLEYIHTI